MTPREQLLTHLAARHIEYAWLFEQSPYGFLCRDGGRPAIRREVWRAMRAQGVSYPAITRACGLRSHSTVVTSVQGGRRRVAAPAT